jgi:hypothetical protein
MDERSLTFLGYFAPYGPSHGNVGGRKLQDPGMKWKLDSTPPKPWIEIQQSLKGGGCGYQNHNTNACSQC